MSKIRFVGLDVHADTIAVAVAEPGGEVRCLGVIPNREESVRRLVRKLGEIKQLRACYEAGPTGYVSYWQLTALGVQCDVIASTLVPVKSGDRVKTDRCDAEKLARCHRAGDLTPVWVPDAAHEALRDLVRAARRPNAISIVPDSQDGNATKTLRRLMPERRNPQTNHNRQQQRWWPGSSR
jgi:transposase